MNDLGKLLGEGQTAEVFEYGDKVLKIFYKNTPLVDINYEKAMGMIINALVSNAPKLHGKLCYKGRTGLLYEMAAGNILRKEIEDKPFQIAKIAKCMAKLHLRVHQKSTAGWTDIPAQNDRLIPLIKKSRPTLGKKVDLVIDYLETLPKNELLCHGDFHPDNIIKGKKAYIIDWTNAYSGHPLSDVARTVIILKSPYVPSDSSLLIKTFTMTLKNLLNNIYLKHYFSDSEYNREDVNRYVLPLACARLCEQLPYEKKWLINLIESEIKRVNL